MISNRKQLIFLVAGIGLVSIFAVLRYTSLVAKLDNIASNPNPLIRHFSPTWRSLKKIIDVPYIVSGVLRSSDLPVYRIKLSRNDRINLINNLPDYPRQNKMTEEFKNTIKAEFRFKDYYTNDAKIRYRGVSPNHWNALKKSLQVGLPSDAPLNGKEDYRFFIGEDKGWIKAFLWNHVADKLGVMSLKAEPVELVVDEQPMGLYILTEGWEESFLERNSRQPESIYSNINTNVHGVDLLRPEFLNQWSDRTNDLVDPTTVPHLRYLLTLIANAPDDVFIQAIPHILDLDQFYRWSLISMLSGNFHQGNAANLNIFFNKATGKFEPILFDASPTRMNDKIDVRNHRIIARITQNARLRKDFEVVAREYLTDENLENDLAFYYEMTRKIRPALYHDTAKIQTTWEALKKIEHDRDIYEYNFRTMQSMLTRTGSLSYQLPDESYPLSGVPIDMQNFSSFAAVFASRSEFLKTHPQFRAGASERSIVLPAGTYAITKDIIIPAGTELTIMPSTQLLFGPEISLISYGPLYARGTALAPIVFKALVKDIPWGVVAVIDTNKKNIFEYTYFDNGKDATINGVYYSGMLSAHRAPLYVSKSTFERARADDAIRTLDAEAIIEYSRFRNNYADSIDIDYAKGQSAIRNNVFSVDSIKDNNGDGVDISFSAIEITGNRVLSCGDKGISVGERSIPVIQDNIIFGCSFGIAVKDGSRATIEKTILAYNKIGLGMYRKKPHLLTGGHPTIENSIIWGNQTNIEKDEFSSATIRNSVIEGGYEGEGNTAITPNFQTLLPSVFLPLLPR